MTAGLRWYLTSTACFLVPGGIQMVLFPWLVEVLGLIPLLLVSPFVALVLVVLYTPFALLFAVVSKCVFVGRYRAMRAPAWGRFYLRHWFVQRAVGAVPWGFLRGTVFYNAALRALGISTEED